MSLRSLSRRTTFLAIIALALTLLACDLNSFIASAPTPTPVPTATPQPTSVQTSSECDATNTQSSGFIKQVVMAQDTQGADKQPVNPTTTFTSSAVFHAVVSTQNAPANTDFKASWCVTDVGNAAAPNSVIDSTDLTTDGSRNIDFTLSPSTTWPTGTYRVLIAVNGTVDTVKNFSVK